MMFDPSLQWSVLRLLATWRRLPLDDLVRLLDPLERPRFRQALLDDMEWEGLVEISAVGDDQVVELTELGEARLAGQRPGPTRTEGDR